MIDSFVNVKLFNLMIATNEVIEDISMHVEDKDSIGMTALCELQNTLIRTRDDMIAYLKKEKIRIDMERNNE